MRLGIELADFADRLGDAFVREQPENNGPSTILS